MTSNIDPLTTADFKFEGHRIRYLDSAPESSLPVIVFVHGWASSSKVYRRQIKHFRHQYRCITFDLLGHGASDAPLPNSVPAEFYSLSGLAKSIIALLSNLSIERATFVGWSLGQAIVLTIALNFPQCVESLVLIASSPVLFLPSDDEDFPAMPRSHVEPFLNLVKTDYKNVVENFVIQQYPEATPELPPDYVKEALLDAASTSPEVAHIVLMLSGNTDFRHVVHKVKASTLIINGSEDRLCTVSAGEWMRDRLGGESVFIPYNCGHVPFVGPTSEKFNLDLEGFLANRQCGPFLRLLAD